MDILIKPILTERMTAQGDKLNRYGFIVDPRANKLEIKAAVEAMYGVVVTSVNTCNYMGKAKSRYTCRFVEWPRKQLQEGVCDAQRRRQDRFLQ